MSEHRSKISWKRQGSAFGYTQYSRNHLWELAEQRISASAAAAFRGDESRVDPEAAFTAALSSCHMLTFLAIASRRGITIDAYEDNASGYLEKNEAGTLVMTRVILRPQIQFAGTPPPPEEIEQMHHESHQECFLANSVKTNIHVETPAPNT